jgi:hypothetical protein
MKFNRRSLFAVLGAAPAAVVLADKAKAVSIAPVPPQPERPRTFPVKLGKRPPANISASIVPSTDPDGVKVYRLELDWHDSDPSAELSEFGTMCGPGVSEPWINLGITESGYTSCGEFYPSSPRVEGMVFRARNSYRDGSFGEYRYSPVGVYVDLEAWR